MTFQPAHVVQTRPLPINVTMPEREPSYKCSYYEMTAPGQDRAVNKADRPDAANPREKRTIQY